MFLSYDLNSLESVSSLLNKLQLLAAIFALIAAILALAAFFAQKRVAFLQKPRSLTHTQATVLTENLKKHPDSIHIIVPATDHEAENYAHEIAGVFEQAGWIVERGLSIKMNDLSGISTMSYHKSTYSNQAPLILKAFQAAGITIENYFDETQPMVKEQVVLQVAKKSTKQ